VLPYLETTAKLLKLLEGVFSFSQMHPESLNNQADFDSAIRRFDPIPAFDQASLGNVWK
jgi:hypothetical protein